MRVLALDTATEACSVALWDRGELSVEAHEVGRGHAERILPMIDARLAAHALRLADLDAIAVGHGPGGFTGVRLAVSVAQGLAFGADLPAIGISDLAAVAQAVFGRDPRATHVLVANDARMQEVYTGFYRRGESGLATLLGSEHVARPQHVAVPAPGDAHAVRVIGAGRGFRAHPAIAGRLRGELAAIDDALLPGAGEIARLAVAALQAGEGVAAASLLPVYLRDDVASPAVTVLK